MGSTPPESQGASRPTHCWQRSVAVPEGDEDSFDESLENTTSDLETIMVSACNKVAQNPHSNSVPRAAHKVLDDAKYSKPVGMGVAPPDKRAWKQYLK